MTGRGFVVVGGGLAGAKTVEGLRNEGYDGPLTLVGDEGHLPYERPALSKEHLLKGQPLADFTPLSQEWYDEHDVTLRLDTPATAIDTAAHTVTLGDGTTLVYDRLALATGSRARVPDLPGVDASGVLLLRTLEDSDAILAALVPGARIVIVGGGWIGLEVAAAARSRDAEVTVLELGAPPLERVLGSTIGAAFADLHRKNGVDLRLGVTVAGIRTDGDLATGVELTDGTLVEADAVVLGVGAVPNVELAQQAGLAVGRGVLVDAALRTSDPDVVAVGDIAEQEHPAYDERVRVEHWANALNQPAVAARTMLGQEAVYDRTPYFYTDQFDLGMEYRGLAPDPEHVVVRGDLSGEYLAFWLDDSDRVRAAMNVNIWDAGDELADLVKRRPQVDPAALADTSVPLGRAERA